MSNTRRNYFLAIMATVFVVLLLLFWGLCYEKPADKDDAVMDREFARLRDSIYTNPHFVLETVGLMQSGMADSAKYYRLEMLKASVAYYQGDNSAGDEVCDRILEYCHRKGDTELELQFWNYHGNYIMLTLGLRDSAKACYSKAYKLLSDRSSASWKVNISINLADACRLTGNPAEASHYYRRALAVIDSTGVDGSLFNVYIGLGQTYAEIANYTEAERYFALAGNMLGDVEGNYDRFLYYNSYGNCLYFAHRYDDALEQFRLAVPYAAKLKQPAAICIAETNLCEVNMMLDSIPQARQHLDRAILWLGKLPGDVLMKFYIYSLAGDLALKSGSVVEANRYFLQAGDTTVVGAREMALHYSRLQRLYASLHDYAKAYHYLQRAEYYDNLIRNNTMSNQIAEIELRYRQDTTIMQQRLVISEKETEVRTLEVQIFVIAIVALLAISGVVIFSMYRRRRRMMEEIGLRQSLYAMRLANIRNRISPHFVFNVLNRELSVGNPGIENLVKLLRTNLQLCDRYIVSLAEELAFVDTYVAVEAPALGSQFRYTKHIADDVDVAQVVIPSMMVQIFVENAIKHGLRGYDGEGKYLDITVERHDDAIAISIENEGNATSHISTSSNTGTGMKVVTQTANLLNERNERNMDINIERQQSADGLSAIYTVTIVIPDHFDFTVINN